MIENYQIDNLEDRLDDHEDRIRRLEQSNIEMKYEILSIKQGQTELKTLTLENHKAHTEQLNNFMNKMAEMIASSLQHNQNMEKTKQNDETKKKLLDRKELWAIGGVIITWLLTQLASKF